MKCFDFGVIREGEITTLELLRALAAGSSAANIQGLAYRDSNSQEVICNDHRPYIQDLDSLPFPARHLLLDMNRYRPPLGCYLDIPVMSMITSRGCPYGCIFCDKNVFGSAIRYHSPDHVVSEIEEVIGRFGAKEIAFLDDTFTTNNDRMREILRLMRKKGIKVKWSCMTRVDTITKELLADMKSAGCWQVSIGAESGNQGVLDFINKNIKLEDIRNTAVWCRQAGLYVKGFFMIGHPIDTIDTINETIAFARSVPFDDIVVTIVTPMPGTRLYEIAPDYGTLRKYDSSDFSYWEPVFVPKGLSESILRKKHLQFYGDFYFRPGVILRQIGKIRSVSRFFKYAIHVPKVILSQFSRP